MSVKLGYEAIEFSIRKWMTKNTKGIATIPGQKMKDKIKILVDKYADQFRIKGQDINTVTVKQVDNAIDYGMTLKKQKVKKAQEQYDKAKKEYDYLTSEKGLEAEYEKLIKKSPEELRDMMRKQGITPVEDKGITSLGKKKYPPFNTSKEDFTKGWTPEVISKEFPLTKDASFRIKQGLSTQIKLNNLGANKQLAKELIGGKNAEFNSLNKIGKKEILDRLDTNIKNAKAEFATPVEPDDLASGGIARVGMAGGGAMWKLVKEFIEKLFIKSSNDIRLGRGKWAGLTQEQWITQHDNLTKMLKKWEHGGKKRLPEGAEQYLGMNDLQIARAVKEAEKKVKKGDLSKYTDEDLNALVAEDKKILAEANKLSEAGTNYGRVSEIEARRKEIKEILEAAQAVPESGYGNIKADLALQKQVSKTKKPKVKDEYYSEKDRNKITKALGTGEDLSNVSSAYAKKYVDQLLTDWKPGKGKKGHASGGIAGQLHLNEGGRARYQHGSRQPGLETSTSRAKQEAQQREIRGIQQAMVDRGGGDAQAYIDEHERIQRRNVGIKQIINKTITDNKIIQDKKRMDIRRQQKDWKRKDNLAWKMFKKTSDQLTDEEEDAINAQILNQDFERFESDLPGKIFKKPPVLLDQSGESDEEQVATMNAITMGKKFLGMNAELTTLFPNRKTGTVGELEKFIDESAVIGSLDMNDVVRFQSIIDSTKNSMMITSNTPIASVAHFVDTGETEVGTGMNIGDISVGADLRFHDGEYVTDDSTINVALPFAKEKRTIRSMTSEGPRKYDPLSPLTYSGKIGAQNLEDFVGEAGINYNISDDLSAGLKTEYLPDDQKNLVANIDYNKAIGPFNITSGLTYNVLDPNLNLDVGVQYDFADDGTLKAGGVFDQSGPNYGITYKRPLRKKPKILGKYAKGGLAKILGV